MRRDLWESSTGEFVAGMTVMFAVLFLLATLFYAWPAEAGAPRYRTDNDSDPAPYTVTISTAAPPTGTPGTAPDGLPWGISLSGLRGWTATVCAESGQTITGAGYLYIAVWKPQPWGPGEWVVSELKWAMAGKTSQTKRCIELGQLEPVIALSERVYVYPSTDFGVSNLANPAAAITVYLLGETK